MEEGCILAGSQSLQLALGSGQPEFVAQEYLAFYIVPTIEVLDCVICHNSTCFDE